MLKCENVQEMMSLYIDNQLNDVEKINFNRHIQKCSQCREELLVLQSIVKTCNDFDEVELPLDFSEQLHHKLIQAQQTIKCINPPWYLNWRMYSGLAAGILLVFVLKSQAFDAIIDSMRKTEKAYVSDTKLEYSTKMAVEADKEEKKEPEDSSKVMTALAGEAVENREEMSAEQPASARQFSAAAAPEERIEMREEVPKQELAPIAPTSIPSVAMDSADSQNGTESGYQEVSKFAKKEIVYRGMYRDKKSLIVYNAVINTAQSDSQILWKELQAQLVRFDGYYELRFRNDKPIVYIAKDKYSELISSVRSTGLEFTIDTSEVDETTRYHDLIAQYDDVEKRISELRSKLEGNTEQQEIDSMNNELQVLLMEQERLAGEIAEMDSAIGKYIIEIHIIP